MQVELDLLDVRSRSAGSYANSRFRRKHRRARAHSSTLSRDPFDPLSLGNATLACFLYNIMKLHLILCLAVALPSAAFVTRSSTSSSAFVPARSSSSMLHMVAADIVNGESKPRRTREVRRRFDAALLDQVVILL